MGKVNLLVKYCLITENIEYNIKGIFTTDEKIKFLDKDSKMLLDKKNAILIRETNDLKIIFDFQKAKCFLTDKSNYTNVSLDLNVIELKNLTNSFSVKYQIAENKYQIFIKIKEN